MLIAAITSCTNTSNPAVMIGRGPAGPQRAPARPDRQALGQDQPGARLARRHGLPARRRAARRPGRCGLLHRRLRLHHLHRQLRSAAAGDLRGRQGRRYRRLRGALRQSQLRGPRASGSEDELPRLAAAGGGLCAGRLARRRSDHRAARHGRRRQAGVPQGHLAERSRSAGDDPAVRRFGDVQEELRQRVRRRRALERHPRAGRQDLRLGRASPPT